MTVAARYFVIDGNCQYLNTRQILSFRRLTASHAGARVSNLVEKNPYGAYTVWDANQPCIVADNGNISWKVDNDNHDDVMFIVKCIERGYKYAEHR